MPGTQDEVWVFGYGSLMWRPGFAFSESVRARLSGYHRAFCVYSIHYRGSTRRPGLVLGLDRGGCCEGLAFRLTAASADATLKYLRRRELIYGVYRETLVPITLLGVRHEPISARTYVAERMHPAYAGALPLSRQAAVIRGARGESGSNLDYLANTVLHLRELGIVDRPLERLLTAAGTFAVRGRVDGEGRPRARALAGAWSRRPVTGMRKPARTLRFVFRRIR